VVLDRLFEQASDAVSKGEADVIVLGCTGMLGVAAELRDSLAAEGFPYRWSTRPELRSRGWRAPCDSA
jgi:hypothetical protein